LTVRRVFIRASCAFVVAAVAPVVGCGDESVRSKAQRTAVNTPEASPTNATPGTQPSATPTTSGGAQQPPKSAETTVTRNPDGSHTITTPGGGSQTKPPPPKATRVRPRRGCDEFDAPPAPGLRAEVVGRSVRIHYRYSGYSESCRPARMVAGISASDGIENFAKSFETFRLPAGTVTLQFPEWWKRRPDVADAGAEDAEGDSGDGAVVRIP
jgi:hypothetical protein